MSGRTRLAVGVLAAWVVTVGWHLKRELLRPPAELLAEGAARLPPGTAYYAVLRGERPVGWAQSRLDTLPSGSGFLLHDRLEARLDLPGGADGGFHLEAETELGPTLALRRFRLRAAGLLGRIDLVGTVRGDSLLELEGTGPAGAVPERIRLDGPVVPEAALPLRFVAWSEGRQVDRFRVPLFDPTTLSVVLTEVEVVEERIRSFPDSAVTDADGRWIPARRDTVRAWLLSREVAGAEVRSWVDEDGRLLEAEVPGGLRLRRTAFELAFYGAPRGARP